MINHQNEQTQKCWWKQGWFLGLLLVAVTLIAYQRIWQAGFVWDDDVMLTGNPLIQAADGLRGIWYSTRLPDYFPMTSTTFWLEWRLWGANPLGYHLVNVSLHALSAVLLCRVLARLKIPGACLAAAVFAVHPVNVESVAWITERKNTLAMFFYMLALLGYLRFEDNGRSMWYGVAIGAFLLALLSKTAVAPLPVVLLGLAWWRRGRVERRDVWRSVPFFAVAALLALVTIGFQYHRTIGSAIVRDDNFLSRLAIAGWAIWFYLYKAVLPVNLVFVYPRWQIDAANMLSYVPGLLVVAGLLMCWRYRRLWGKALLFGLGYFVVLLLPVLGFLNISFMRYSLVADHWQYFAILGPITLAAAGISTAASLSWNKRPLLEPALGGTLVLVLGVLTWRQCGMYTGLETLWQRTIARNPNCYLAYCNIGNDLLQKGQVDEAIRMFEKALKTQPPFVETPHYLLGNALLQKVRNDEAIIHYRAVLEIRPDFVSAIHNLGIALLQKGQTDEAVAHFRKIVELQPGSANAHNNLGWMLRRTGQLDEAKIQLEKALEIQPDYPEAHINLAKTLLQSGQVREAVTHYRAALKVQPDDPQSLSNLAWVLATYPEASVRNGPEAIQLAQRANQLTDGQKPMNLRALAAAYAEGGRFAEAVTAAQRALQLASAQFNAPLVGMLQSQIKLYQAGSPYRDIGQTDGANQVKP
jgi:tetratricopeptide (TPR) repeat protein